jgi:hypothetical protein
MTAQENVALARSLFDLYNSHQSDPAWLDKTVASIADDCEIIDVPTGRTLRGPDGYRQTVLFFAEGFPDSRIEMTNVFSTEDQLVIEFTGRGPTLAHCICPREIFPRQVGILSCGSVV